MAQNYRLDTLAIHGGYTPDIAEHSTAVPIYQTNAYAYESVQHATDLFNLSRPGNIYTRLNNPTNAVLEERVSLLDGGVGGLAMASGHSAIFSTILCLAGAGDEIVSSRLIYGGAINMLGITLGNIGIKVNFVDPDDLDAWEAAVNNKTKAFFVEIVGNPNANVVDLEGITRIAHRHGIPMISDSSMTTPYLIKPIEYQTDIVIHSATKYLGGHGTSMAGVIVDSGNFQWEGNPRFPQFNSPDVSYHGVNFGKDCGRAGFITRLRTLQLRDIGACLSPFNSFMILQGIETLSLRMRRHCDNADAVAGYLESHKGVAKVNYPGLKSNKYYPLVQKYLPKGCGSVFTFELEGGKAAGVRFMESLSFIRNVSNLGDSRSIVSHPATTTHSQLSEQQLIDAGISSGTVRISVGIEDIEDILEDLERAMDSAVGR